MTSGAPHGTEAPSPSRRQWLGFGGVATASVAIALVIVAGLFVFVLQGCAFQTPTAPPLPPSPVDGVVVSVEAASLGDVKGFSLRTTDGVVYALKLGTLENATQFSPSHLAEHEATSSPIRAWYWLENGVPTVYRVEDASG